MVSVAKIGKKYKHGFTTRKEYSKIQSSQNKGKETSYILPDTTYLCLNKCFNEINPIFNTNRNLNIPFDRNDVKRFCGPSSSYLLINLGYYLRGKLRQFEMWKLYMLTGIHKITKLSLQHKW